VTLDPLGCAQQSLVVVDGAHDLNADRQSARTGEARQAEARHMQA